MIPHYSQSSTGTYRRCLWKFAHLYGGERPEAGQDKPGPRMGSAGHMGLKGYYLALQMDRVHRSADLGTDWGKVYEQALGWAQYDYDPRTEEEMAEYRKLEEILRTYFRQAAMDRWKILLVEEKVKVGRFMGIIDVVAQDEVTGKVFIVDHKFQKSTQVSHLALDAQVSFYLMLASKLDFQVDGLLYNMVCTGTQKGEKQAGKIIRNYIRRSTNFLNEFERDLNTQVQQMDEFLLHPTPYRNPTKDCPWDCDLYEHCQQSMQGVPSDCTICSQR